MIDKLSGKTNSSVEKGKIAFVRQERFDDFICIMSDDEKDWKSIIKGKDPSWSSDGKQLAFTHKSGVQDVCIVDEDGSNMKALTANESPYSHDAYPHWDPNGEYIVFCSERATEHWQIFIMTASGSNQEQLTTSHFNHPDIFPQISPDSKKIVFERRGHQEAIHIMDIDGSNPTSICDGRQPSWAPDGNDILFVRRYKIYSRNLHDDVEKEIGIGKKPSYACNGRKIVFCRGEYSNEQLWIMDSSGQNANPIIEDQGNRDPVWISI